MNLNTKIKIELSMLGKKITRRVIVGDYFLDRHYAPLRETVERTFETAFYKLINKFNLDQLESKKIRARSK